MKTIQIGERIIGDGQPCFIIAELSANHGGSLERALEAVDSAHRAGADAVKLQTYTADTITLKSDKPDFLLASDSPWSDWKTLHALFDEAHTPWEWHKPIFEKTRALGMEYFSSPFDETAVHFLAGLDVPAYKVASPEITDIPLIRLIAGQGKPVIMSTGLAEEADIRLALAALKEGGCEQVILLKCTSAYPTPLEECNLRTMPSFEERFSTLYGLSDHTMGSAVPSIATALGACVIEKHFIPDKSKETADSFFSLDEQEFGEMVAKVRDVEKALGTVSYDISASAQKNLRGRRSLYVCKSIRKGERLGPQHIKSVRPSFGLHPQYYDQILGERVLSDLGPGDRLSWDVIDAKPINKEAVD
jgi:N-acetylneuraminate synthase/pseudaminic acid synthase